MQGIKSFIFPLKQILSNEEKRLNFDRYGDVGENQGYPQQQQQQHRPFHHFHESFYFDESFFHFPFNSDRRDSSDEKYLLHFSHYVQEIVPDSFRKPYLIKITSDWCFSCIHIEPVWKEVVQELEGLGKHCKSGVDLIGGLVTEINTLVIKHSSKTEFWCSHADQFWT